jgi:hypothetical protein
MAVTAVQEQALRMIEQDPEAMRVMQEQIHRLDPKGEKIPKSALPDIVFKQKLDEALAPLKEKNEELSKKLAEREKIDDNNYQRDFMRRKYNLSDKQIDELAEWMEKDGEGNIYKNYENAHLYRLSKNQPTLPNGNGVPVKRSIFTGREPHSEDWRAEFEEKNDHPLRSKGPNSRRTQRNWAKEKWAETMQQLRNR